MGEPHRQHRSARTTRTGSKRDRCGQGRPTRLTPLRRLNNFSARAGGTGTTTRPSRSTAKDQANRERDKKSAVATKASRVATGGKRCQFGGPQAESATSRNRTQKAGARCRHTQPEYRALEDPAVSDPQERRIPGDGSRDPTLR